MHQKVLYCELMDPPPVESWTSPVLHAVTNTVAVSLLRDDPECIAAVIELGKKSSEDPEELQDQGVIYAYLACFAPGVSRTAMKFWPQKVKPDDVALSKSGILWSTIFSFDDYSPASARRIADEIAKKFRAEAVAYTGPTGYEGTSGENQSRPTIQ